MFEGTEQSDPDWDSLDTNEECGPAKDQANKLSPPGHAESIGSTVLIELACGLPICRRFAMLRFVGLIDLDLGGIAGIDQTAIAVG